MGGAERAVARNYENWIKAYVNHTRYSESPDNFHFWTAVGTVAGALRRRVWIDQRIFQWTPNFYIILVGPPGVAAKSTSIRQGLSLLERVPGVNFGPQSMTWQALADAMQKATEGVEIDGEIHIQSCLTISISELGTFLRPDDDELLSTLIAMWDGQKEAWRRSTRTQGDTVVQNPWINLIGCTTPAWIRANIPNSMVGGGLTSRIIFVYGEAKRQLVAYPGMQITGADFGKEEELLTEDLSRIAELAGEYHLDSGAIAWGEDWYHNLNTKREDHLQSERFDGYIARKQTHLHKLAMVFAASQRDELIITRDDLILANEVIRLTENDMIKVFHSIGVSPGAALSREILNTIRNAGTVSYARLWRECSATMPLKDFMEAIKGLIEADEIELTTPQGGQRIVRPKRATLPASTQ
jgi:hypothetical protein